MSARSRDFTLVLIALSCLPVVAACVAGEDEQPHDGEHDSFLDNDDPLDKADSVNGIERFGWEAQCVLNLVNSADQDTLDHDAHLFGIAARGIARRRAGADGQLDTADDVLYTDLRQLDDISFVGPIAFFLLSDFAEDADVCPGIAQEYPPAGELEAIARTKEIMLAMFHRRAQIEQPPVRRDAHAKHHGCVRATFEVDNTELSDELRAGVFADNRTYDAWVRFSNSDFRVSSDKLPDARGMAIKLVGVPGTKLMEDELTAQTQDFVMINHPEFVVRNAVEYVEFSSLATTGDTPIASASNLLQFFLSLDPTQWRIREMLVSFASIAHKMASPLESRFFSQTPYKLGEGAIKFSARPCDGENNSMPLFAPDDYLRQAMVETLDTRGVCFELQVQPQRHPGRQPIEDPTIHWDEREAPFITVATLNIEAQTFDTEEQQSFCEHLSFTPWHSLPEHRPLGGINRTRRSVMQEVSRLRHEMNGVARQEPVDLSIPGQPE